MLLHDIFFHTLPEVIRKDMISLFQYITRLFAKIWYLFFSTLPGYSQRYDIFFSDYQVICKDMISFFSVHYRVICKDVISLSVHYQVIHKDMISLFQYITRLFAKIWYLFQYITRLFAKIWYLSFFQYITRLFAKMWLFSSATSWYLFSFITRLFTKIWYLFFSTLPEDYSQRYQAFESSTWRWWPYQSECFIYMWISFALFSCF